MIMTSKIKKPRIFIGMHYMHLGGVETSLVGLLQQLKPEKVDVDLFVYSQEGGVNEFDSFLCKSFAREFYLAYV